ncbi:hypothetical protein FLX35_05265 [Cylindrospermopsis raciborskii LB2897]|nr:hypothetical protein [Cylindrospermopsis raciborskii LB2897]
MSSGVTQIFSTGYAFAALKSDGSVVTWGDSDSGGDSSSVAGQLTSGVVSFADPFNDDRLVPLTGSSVTLAVSPTTVTEDGTSNLIYTFTRTGVTSNQLTVNYTVGGTATNGTDYSTIGTSVTFAANSSTATVTVDPTTDTMVESDETVSLTLASGTGYTIGTTSAVTGTITNDDVALPTITLAVSPSSVTEDGTSNLIYTFTRTGVTSNALTVNYTVGGTATFNSDYTQREATSFTATAGTITFVAGASTAALVIDPTSDTGTEGNETVTLALASGSGYTIGTTSAVNGSILDNDVIPGTVVRTPIVRNLSNGTRYEWRNSSAFAALKSDGSVVTWGESSWGGNSSSVASQLTGGVTQIFSTFYAFAALKNDGSVVTWGWSSYGGDSSSVASQLT